MHVLDRVQEARRLLNSECCDFLSFDFRQPFLECIGWVAREQLLLNCAAKGGLEDDVNVTARERGQTTRLAVPSAACSPGAIGTLNLDGRKLRKRKLSECWNKIVPHDLRVSFVCLWRNLRSNGIEPRF